MSEGEHHQPTQLPADLSPPPICIADSKPDGYVEPTPTPAPAPAATATTTQGPTKEPVSDVAAGNAESEAMKNGAAAAAGGTPAVVASEEKKAPPKERGPNVPMTINVVYSGPSTEPASRRKEQMTVQSNDSIQAIKVTSNHS
jgi:hypothetical protein